MHEQRDLLWQLLPSAQHATAATAQAETLLQCVTVSDERFAETWTAFLTGLEHAVTLARDVAAAHGERRSLRYQLADLIAQCGPEMRGPAVQ